MGFPPDSYDIASILDEELGILPICTEAADAVIEAVMGTYAVAGDLQGELRVTNVDVAQMLVRHLRSLLDDEVSEAGVFAYEVSSATVRRITEELIVARLLTELPCQYFDARLVSIVRAIGGDPYRALLPQRGPRSDDLLVCGPEGPITIVEVKASLRGFIYPLRATRKAAWQLAETLATCTTASSAALVLVDLAGHNIAVAFRSRDYWLETSRDEVCRDVRSLVSSATWFGVGPLMTSTPRP